MENQDRSILATVKLTEDEYKDINIFHYKHVKKDKKKYLFILVIISVLLCISIAGTIMNQNNPTSGMESEVINIVKYQEIIPKAIPLFIILMAILTVLIYVPNLIKKSAVKEFRSNNFAQKELSYHFLPDYIEIDSEDFQMKLRYENIHKVMVMKKYIVIFDSEKLIRILPKRSFETDEAVMSVLKLLEANLSKDKYEVINK